MTAVTATIKPQLNFAGALRILANQYDTLPKAVLELIQNALDAGAKRIHILINFKTGEVYVRDNGRGVTVEEFNQKLKNIGRSNKGKDDLGRFGIGFFSGAWKCATTVLTSCAEPSTIDFIRWTIHTVDLEDEKGITSEPLNNLIFQGKAVKKSTVDWRTEVKLIGLTNQSKRDFLEPKTFIEEIRSRFRVAMNIHKTTISLTIRDEKGKEFRDDNIVAPKFQGQRLPHVELKIDGWFRCSFDLYKVDPGKKSLGVHVSPEDSLQQSVPITKILSMLTLPPEMKDALKGKVIEGTITAWGLQLKETRETFVPNDAFLKFETNLRTWWEKHGSELIGNIKNQQVEERRQEAARKCAATLEKLLQEPELDELRRAVINGLTIGSIGKEHLPVPINEQMGPQDHRSLRTTQHTHPTTPSKTPSSKEDEKLDTPFTAAGPNGQQRTKVNGRSFGIQIQLLSAIGFNEPFRIQLAEGLIQVNVAHPLYSRCEDDKNPAARDRYLEIVSLMALRYATCSPVAREHVRDTLFKLLADQAALILGGPKIREGFRTKRR